MGDVVKVTINRDGLRSLARTPQVRAACAARAEAIKAAAVALAPVESGTYKRSFRTYHFTTRFGGFDRAMSTVVNEAPYAAAVEFGTARQRGQHVLARALASVAVTP